MISTLNIWSRLLDYCRSSSANSEDSNEEQGEDHEVSGRQAESVQNDTLQEGIQQTRAEDNARAKNQRALLNVTGFSGTQYSIMKVVGKGGFGEVQVRGQRDSKNCRHAAYSSHKDRTAEQPGDGVGGHVHFCTLFDKGYDENSGHYFMVMTMLGPNLSFIRKAMPKQRLTPRTSIRVAIQMMNAIEHLHSKGYVSRDVKPSNFAIGLPTQHRRLVYMIDFGIAFRYLNSDGTYVKQSASCTWRGTTRYCSLANHRRMSPGPKDDLESWLYSSVELLTSTLPWSSLDKKAKEQTYKLKLESRTHFRHVLFRNCPEEFSTFIDIIDSYSYYDKPDYGRFCVALTKILDRNKIKFTDPYDWEVVFEPYMTMNDDPS